MRSTSLNKKIQQAKIEEDIKKYLASGKKIKVIGDYQKDNLSITQKHKLKRIKDGYYDDFA